MTERVLVVGAGGLGLEVAWLARRAGHDVVGFLDDDPARHGTTRLGLPVHGPADTWRLHGEVSLTVAVGSPAARRTVVERLRAQGRPRFATLVDPAAVLDRATVRLGAGCTVAAGVVCTVETVLGEHVLLDRGCTVGHESRLGDYCTVAPLASLSGAVVLDAEVQVGTGALVRQGVHVGRGAVLGMGAVVLHDAAEGSVLVGNPARPLLPGAGAVRPPGGE